MTCPLSKTTSTTVLCGCAVSVYSLFSFLVKAAVLHVNSTGGVTPTSPPHVADVGDVGNVPVAVAPGNLRGGRPIVGGVFHHPQCVQVSSTWCFFPLKFCLGFGMRLADAGGCSSLCRGIFDVDDNYLI